MTSDPTLHKKPPITAQVLILGSVVGLIAACTPTLNSGKLETDIQQWLEQEKNINTESVSCPARIQLEVGNTVECEAKTEDGTQPIVAVTLDSEEGKVSLALDDNNGQDSSTELASSDDSSTLDSDSDDSTTSDSDSGDSTTSDSDSDDSTTSDSDFTEIDPNAPRVDIDFVESTLKDQFKEQTGISVRSVECPKQVAVQVKGKFDCTVKSITGKTIEAKVVQTNKQGGFSWNSEKGLISLNKVEDLIKNAIQEQDNLTVTPKCGTSRTRYKIAYAGDRFRCRAKSSTGRSIPIRVSVKTDYGQVIVNWPR